MQCSKEISGMAVNNDIGDNDASNSDSGDNSTSKQNPVRLTNAGEFKANRWPSKPC